MLAQRIWSTAAVATVALLVAGGATETSGSGTPAGTPTSASPADNGVAALSPEQILGKAKAALAAATSVHIKGSGEDQGFRMAIDMRYGPDQAAGTLVLDGQRVDLSRVQDAVYLKGGTGFWTAYADAATAKVLAGKYLKTTASDDRFIDLTDFTDLQKSAYDFLDLSGPLSKGSRKTVVGIPAIEVVDKGQDGGTLDVATTGQPYPLSIQSPSDELTFSEYGRPVSVTQPPAAQVVDADSLPGR
jgi:hypothetical protein